MDSITQILNSINSFSKQNFKFTQFIQPLIILKKIPISISYELNNEDFIFHLNVAYKHINWLNAFLNNNLTKLLKKEVNKLKNYKSKDTSVPYAGFKIDDIPVFKKNFLHNYLLMLSSPI